MKMSNVMRERGLQPGGHVLKWKNSTTRNVYNGLVIWSMENFILDSKPTVELVTRSNTTLLLKYTFQMLEGKRVS